MKTSVAARSRRATLQIAIEIELCRIWNILLPATSPSSTHNHYTRCFRYYPSPSHCYPSTMSAIISRQLVQRPSQQLTSIVRSHVSVRGQATTTKAKEAVQNVTSKASQGLTKVSSSVSETTSSMAGSAAETAKSSGGRIGKMVQTVQGMSIAT